MDFDFSSRSEDAINHALAEAKRINAFDVTPEHLFFGIVKTDDQTRKVLLDLGINVDEVLSVISKLIPGPGENPPHKYINLSKSSEKILKIVPLEAKLLKQKLVEPYHILLSIL